MKSSINNLEIYRDAMDIGQRIWDVAVNWGVFEQSTVGSQNVRAGDSIAANLAEGYGRYHYKDNQRFCYYSRGSAEEAQTWLEKASRRALMDRDVAKALYDELEVLKKRLNAYIGSIGNSDDH